MHVAMAILLVVLVLGVFLLWAVAGNRAEHDDIKDWAIHNGYHLLQVKRRFALLSPFRWDMSRQAANNPYVFYVELLTQEHTIRRAWVRVYMGFRNNSVDVRWAK